MITINKADVTIIGGNVNEGKTARISLMASEYAYDGYDVLMVIFEEGKESYIKRFGEVEGIHVVDGLSSYPITLDAEIIDMVVKDSYGIVCIDGLDRVSFDDESAYKNAKAKNEFLMSLSINCGVPILSTTQTIRESND